MKVNFILDQQNIIAEVNHGAMIKRKRFGLNIQISPQYWNTKTKRVKLDRRAGYAQSTNDLLDKFESTVKNYFNDSTTKDTPINIETLESYLKEKYFISSSRRIKKSLLEYMEKFRDSKTGLTKNNYTCSLNLMLEFLAYLKVKDFDMEYIDKDFMLQFEKFFYFHRTETPKRRNRNENTLAAYVLRLNTILNDANNKGFIQNLKYKQYKASKHIADKIIPTKEDIDKIFAAELPHDLSIIRDMYVLYCDISLRYGDGQRLEKGKHFFFENGKWYLNILPEKTKRHSKMATIPINSRALSILERYNFTTISLYNSKFNDSIKEIFELAGVGYLVNYVANIKGQNVEMTARICDIVVVHSSRAYFITQCFANGLTGHEISKITGLDEKTLVYYDKTKSKDVALRVSDNPFFN